MNAGPRSREGLSNARRLARSLLAEATGDDVEQRVVAAFRSFIALSDDRATAALDELRLALRTRHPEPHFLELLQAEADRAARKRHGMYFTPGPVVEFLIRRVEQLVPEGPLRIVDPACGGGAFLLAAQELAARRPGSQVVGFDVSSAAVEVTRLVLRGVGFQPASNTDALAGWKPALLHCLNPLLAGGSLAPYLLGDETLVILGNPPYANYGRLNRGPWIDALLSDYRVGVAERKLNLTDDFIKFLRWGQYWIGRAGRGVLAMITSRTYLSGVTHRGMRHSLSDSFPQIEIIDLHGDGDPDDENIFAIRRGVAIGVFSHVGQASSLPFTAKYISLLGSRDEKLHALANAPPHSQSLQPQSPDYLFIPAPISDATSSDYLSWPRLDEIFPEFMSGVQTKNDALLVDFDREVLAGRMREHLGERFDPTLIQPYVVGPFDRRWIYYDRELVGRPRWPVMQQLLQPGNLALVFMRQSTNSGEYDHALIVDCLASDRTFYSRRGAPFVAPLWGKDQKAEGRRQKAEVRNANLAEAWVNRMAERLGARPESEELFTYVYAVLHSPAYRERHRTELMRDFPRIPWPRSRERFEQLAQVGGELIALHLRPIEREFSVSLSKVGGSSSATGEECGRTLKSAGSSPVRTAGRRSDPDSDLKLAPEREWNVFSRFSTGEDADLIRRSAFVPSPVAPKRPPTIVTLTRESTPREAIVARGFPKYEGGFLQLNRDCSLPLDAAAWSYHVGGYRVIERWLQARRGRTLSSADLQHLAWLEHVSLETRRLLDQLGDL